MRQLRRSTRTGKSMCGASALLALLLITAGQWSWAQSCRLTPDRQLLWGDLHVHTAYSLDAWAFGALATPEDAYRFARGASLKLDSGEIVQIDRPLDFAAVTDHAETFDFMYTCTDPVNAPTPYCEEVRALREARNPRSLFNDYLLPIVSLTPPAEPALCATTDCGAARLSQWRRIQQAANDANVPCEFTALIGYEWTASPGGRHWHRNVIYRSAEVPHETFDYVRYPEVEQLWAVLARHCRAEAGCNVLTIPHNINWADGGTFDLGNASARYLELRVRYERLAEIHQEKGSSECLPDHPEDPFTDCRFELVTQNAAKLRMSGPAEDEREAWEAARQSYWRTLLGQGLELAATPGGNPLMLGAIGSTDTHFGTPGMVAEASFFGGIAQLWQPDASRLTRPDFNGGGLVAVWATENTRSAVFDALERREAYATSGPRIALKFGTGGFCSDPATEPEVAMGGVLTEPTAPAFSIMAARDQVALAAVDLVKGSFVAGSVREEVIHIADFPEGRNEICLTWTDPDFRAEAPAYWYVRVLEQPTPRWSKLLCERLDNCADHPEADRLIQERAWSSPIWYQPSP